MGPSLSPRSNFGRSFGERNVLGPDAFVGRGEVRHQTSQSGAYGLKLDLQSIRIRDSLKTFLGKKFSLSFDLFSQKMNFTTAHWSECHSGSALAMGMPGLGALPRGAQ